MKKIEFSPMTKRACLLLLGLAAATLAPAQNPATAGSSAPTSATANQRIFGPGYDGRDYRGGGFRGGPGGRGGRGGMGGGRSMMDGRGPGDRGRGGFGMAGPAAGRPRPIPRRWDEIEQQIQSCRSKYETIEQQRGKKLLEYDALKKKDQPEKIDASTVVVRNAIDKVLAELHQNMEDSRDNTQEAAEILSGTIFTREIWEPTLRPAPGAAATQPLPAGVAGQRKEAWLKGLERWEKEGPEGFARAVLGDQFGLLVLQTLPERIWRPEMFLTGRGGAGPFPLSGPALDEIRQNWLARIDRMERQQEDLANEMRRQDRELRQMRMILDNLLNQPGPGPDPSNPGPTPPEENKK